MDAVEATTQEVNRKIWSVERALDRARDLYRSVADALTVARKEKKTLRVLELQPEVADAQAALDSAVRDYEEVCGVAAPLSTGPQTKPGTINALRAANAEFRQIDDEVTRCERELNRLRPRLAQVDHALALQGQLPSVTTTTADREIEITLDVLYPERKTIRAANCENLQRATQTNLQLRKERTELVSELQRIEAERMESMGRRDAMFAQYKNQAGGH